ncbi:MAG: ExeM/NucH family extracellular endonuclease [Acidimicrobiia bacterium]|nr:ExeM/NucH family extracellular endonuclease [Acidimicrobiia bacterium]
MAGSLVSGRRIRLAVTLALVSSVLALSATASVHAAEPAADHLLLSEFAVTPTAGEFVEIFNPTDATVDLTDVYLTDATFAGGPTYYYQIVTGGGGGGGFGDFHARFPAGASIAAGEYQTVALNGSDDFLAAYGVAATYELYDDAGAADGVPAMLEATAGSIGGQGGLSDGEVLVLYSWDGATDLVQDHDYVVFGDKAEAVDKTGVAIDGPDAGTDTSAYLPDTSVASQDAVAPDQVHTSGLSWQRADLTEGVETRTGGNGVTGNDETSEASSVTWGETVPTPNAATTLPPPAAGGGLAPLPPLGACGDPFTAIYEIQGATGDGAFEDGTPALTEGVVTGIFEGYGGYNIQDATGDGDAATSDGIFVAADTAGVTVGNTVRIVGRTMELFGLSEITGVEGFLDCGAGPAIAPTVVDLPLTAAEREPFEGMLITLSDTMVATDTYNLPNFGEVWIAADMVVRQPTNVYSVGDPALQDLADENMARAIILDDGSTSTPAEVPYLPAGGTLRLGDTASTVTGVMHYSFGQFRINPTVPVTFTESNPRPAAPAVGGDVTVATFNVLNYWTTLGGRGASTAEQLDEQTEGLVAAIMGLGADIIGLQEMENDPAHTPITTLVAELNAAEGSTVWAWVGEVNYYNDYPIRNEIIYRIGAVDPLGDPLTIEDPAFDDIAPGGTSQLGRPPVAQTFIANGEKFTVVSNHFKSKSCTASSGDDADMGDGQACYNARRVLQAERVLEFVGALQAFTGDDDVIVLGDLNAYMAEDPILELETELTNVFAEMNDDPYTYNFFAASSAPWIGRGNLDHILVTPEMAYKVSGVEAWNINGDEPNMLGWNTPALSAPGPYRSSDHDPIVMGIRTPSPFTDTVGNIFADDIFWVAQAGITFGCNPPVNDEYCPNDLLTRGQLAAMFVRALYLPASATDYFTDDDTSIFEDDINALAEAGITLGCNPPANDNYCPNDSLTRGQIAAFWHRALG